MTQTAYLTAPAPVADSEAPTGRRRRRGALTLGLLAAVVVLDHTTKWWAWRHAPKAIVNTGSTWFIGDPVSGWFSGPVSGLLLDLLNVGLLSLAGSILVRRRRRPLLVVAGTLMISGWGSNVLDRLGMHALSAPGSDRGAVDFIPLGGDVFFNLADVVIAAATVLYLVAAVAGAHRRVGATSRAPRLVPAPHARGGRSTDVAAVDLAIAVGLALPAAVGASRGDGGTPVTLRTGTAHRADTQAPGRRRLRTRRPRRRPVALTDRRTVHPGMGRSGGRPRRGTARRLIRRRGIPV